MPRYKLTIAYDGTDFCGWQKQEPLAPTPLANPPSPWATPKDQTVFAPGEATNRSMREALPERPGRVALRSVQHVVERTVREVVREIVDLKGSSRTDSGVHARGQVAAFSCADGSHEGRGWPLSRGTDALVRALNGKLPDDVLIMAAEPVPDTFDPIGDTLSKGYSYTIHASRTRTLFDRRYVHQVWEPLDLALMQDAARAIVGEKDFAAFAAAGHNRQTTVRTVYTCDVTRLSDERIRIDVSSNGFLYNMVRIIAGTLVDAGRRRTDPDTIRKVLDTRDRTLAGPTLPPTGLCLEWIRYPEHP
jgi:tRNA pseudouridine38-40 synthase